VSEHDGAMQAGSRWCVTRGRLPLTLEVTAAANSVRVESRLSAQRIACALKAVGRSFAA
jgi:hypothetical protein